MSIDGHFRKKKKHKKLTQNCILKKQKPTKINEKINIWAPKKKKKKKKKNKKATRPEKIKAKKEEKKKPTCPDKSKQTKKKKKKPTR